MFLVILCMPLVFSLLMATEKAPVAVFLLGVMLSVAWAKLGGRLSLRILLLFGMVVPLRLRCHIFFSWEMPILWQLYGRSLAVGWPARYILPISILNSSQVTLVGCKACHSQTREEFCRSFLTS